MAIAQRRHHIARLKKNRRFYWGRDLSKEPKYLSMVVNCTHNCSCYACGNQRRYEGATLKERVSMKELDYGF